MVPRAVLMKSGLKSFNTARPVNTTHPKTIVYSDRPMSHFPKSAQSTVKRPYQIRTTLTNKNSNQKVNTAKGKFYTARPKAVNTARPNSAVVNDVRANQGHPQKEDQGYVDSGCSRHMTGNMSYLLDFKEFDRGYVTFGGGAKGGKITSKGTLKTADESQVLLEVPRKNNMYSVDIKNIVPKECLTCLVAKATLDESMLWQRRLGHNRVLVVKPHNKTPYEMFRDEGFFVGYLLNSKVFRVYNIRTRKLEENFHIRFLEDKPIIAGTEESIGAGHSSKETGSSQDCILMPDYAANNPSFFLLNKSAKVAELKMENRETYDDFWFECNKDVCELY
ncbi:hypothetical protein Tco_0223556 [Tanacetum coccineum]